MGNPAIVVSDFGEVLRRHRLASGLTQEALAERAGLSARGIGDLERGARSVPQRETLRLLAEALNLTPAERAAFAAAGRRGASARSSRTTSPHPSGALAALPVPPTPLVGREREVADASGLLHRTEVRLLTLTGPGGVGKTRLALRVATDLRGDFADGAQFVGLADIDDAALVPSAIAQRLGVKEAGAQPLPERLTAHLRDKHLLLVLDNFEHLLDAAPPVVAEVLAACPRVKVLTTSRARLRLRGEREYPVPPLALPDPDRRASVKSLAPTAAVRLFIERARDVKPDFALTDDNAAAVAAICRRLDGLPLAIELAAARVKLLSPAALLVRLERRLPLLVGGARDLPARQRTLRDTIAWSHDLLTEEEQALFRRLSVFGGGGTLDAVEGVLSAESRALSKDDGAVPSDSALGTQHSALDALASLVDGSLVWRDEQADDDDDEAAGPRFGMLETMREFGLERLAANGEVQVVRRAHAAYYVELAERLRPRIEGPDGQTVLDRLEREHANLRAALAWAVDVEAADLALRLGAALWKFWFVRGHLREGMVWLERALGLEDASALGARTEVLYGAGCFAREQRRYAQAVAYGEELVSSARSQGDTLRTAMGLFLLGTLAVHQGDFDEASMRYEAALALFRGLDHAHGTAMLLSSLGDVACERRDGAAAVARYEEALALWQARGDRWGTALALQGLADVARREGDRARAVALFRDVLAHFVALGDVEGVGSCLENLALLATECRQPVTATRLFGTAAALRDRLGIAHAGRFRAAHDHAAATTRAELGERAFAAIWAEGRNLTIEQAVAEATAITPPPA